MDLIHSTQALSRSLNHTIMMMMKEEKKKKKMKKRRVNKFMCQVVMQEEKMRRGVRVKE